MGNKPETRLVRNNEDLARLVSGDLVSLNLGPVTLPAAYVGENRFVARFHVGDRSNAASYVAAEISYNGVEIVLKEFEAQNYDNFRQIPGPEYFALIRAGLVTE